MRKFIIKIRRNFRFCSGNLYKRSMKKFILIISVFCAGAAAFSADSSGGQFSLRKIETGISGSVYVRTDSPENSTYSASSSAKIVLSGIDVKAAYRIPSVQFGGEIDYDEWSLGAALHLKSFTGLPASVLLGKLNFSGSVSTLKTPYISTSATCFGSTPSRAGGISVTLPGITSNTKPLAGAFVYKTPPRTILRRLDFCFFADGDGNCAQSSCISLKAGKKATVSFSQTFGSFFISHETAQWFSQSRLFPRTQFWCGDFQAALSSPFYNGKWRADFYRLGSSAAQWCVSGENEIKAGQFSLFLSGFFLSSPDMLTPPSKKIKIRSQIKLNPTATFFPFHASRLRAGCIFYREERFLSEYETESIYKWGGGLNYTDRIGSSRLTFVAAQNTYTMYSYYSVRAAAKPSFSATYALTTEESGTAVEKQEIKTWCSVSVPVRKNTDASSVSVKLAGTALFEDGFSYGTAAVSAALKYASQKAVYSASLNVKCRF